MPVNHSVNFYSPNTAHFSVWLTPTRVETPELLDSGMGTDRDVAANLNEMWRLNRFLGGFRALTQHLYPRIASAQSTVTIVDLGTGSAQMLRAITRWAWLRHYSIRCIGVDWAGRNLNVARHVASDFPEITLVRADAMNLPYPNESVDYIISSLFLHHFAPEQIITLLRTSFNVARRGIIMTDLVRGWLPLIGFTLIQPIFARNFLTRHDGAVSIRRACTPSELRELAQAAGLRNAQVHWHFPWRMTLVADK